MVYKHPDASTNMYHITDATLLACFRGPSPLSRRTLRARLGFPPHATVSAVLFSAVQRGLLVQHTPRGCNASKITVFATV